MTSVPGIWRIRLIYAVVVVVALLLTLKLFFVQIVQGEYYIVKADRQYQQPARELLDRGTIFFQERDGTRVSAATMQNGFLLAINNRELKNPNEVFTELSRLLPLDRDLFYRRAAKLNDPYEEIAFKIDATTAAAIDRLKLPGVFVVKDRWRVYPAGRLAAHVVGFLGYEDNQIEGRYGLERYYEDVLSREADPSFLQLLFGAISHLGQSARGEISEEADLVLTIEPTVQGVLEQELAKIYDTYNAELVGGLIINPHDGAIYALGALPNFHPGERQDNITTLSNPLVEGVFEMGSIVKPLTVAAALDAGVITPSTQYVDPGMMQIEDRLIGNYDGRARGQTTIQEVLNQSLNTGAVFAMRQLGTERFRDYFVKFGLAEPSGIDLPNDATGLLDNLDSTREIEFATAAFGQGIAMSPLAMTRALAALGNGGRLVTPHIVAQIENRVTGFSTKTTTPPGRPVITPATSKTITDMLVAVVDTALSGGRAKLPNYTVAAKTGTAQIAAPQGGYYPDRYLHSFFGYFPAYQPQFLIFLYAVNPRGVTYASETWTQPFMDLTRFLLGYYQVPPDH